MSLTAHRTASCIAVLLLPFPCFAQADTVGGYAAFCYSQIGVSATDVENVLWGTGRPCYYGTKLTTKHEGTELDKIPLANRRSANFLNRCDAPAWLESGGTGGQCYGGTYITTLEFTDGAGNIRTDVKGALLCRHKTRDPALDPVHRLPKDDDFDDVAMILHNKTTGKTCWFQTDNGSTAMIDGRKVPPPHVDPAYWLKPSETSAIKCARCHDNGPWMNSQWLYSQHPAFEDKVRDKYETPKYTATIFNWPKTDDFIDIGRRGLEGTRLPKCNKCHKLSARIDWSGEDNGTYRDWFAYTTGWLDYVAGSRKEIPQATAYTPGRVSRPGDYLYTHWMPPDTGERPTDATTYKTQYATHLRELKKCMEAPRLSRTAPCQAQPLSLGNPTPTGTGAMVSATVVETGGSYTATAASAPATPTPQVVGVGHTLRLGWQADARYESCTIEATLPAGVLVPVTGPSGPTSIATGASWQLPEAPPLIGPLTEPGIYEFSIYCNNEHEASLQFQVGTTGPRSLVKLVTSVNKTVQATAVHSHSVMQPTTTTSARNSDSVELTWIAYNVLPSSCTFRGPGAADVVLTEAVGEKTITFAGSTDQVFTFQCTGANDSVTRTVSSTLRPADIPAGDLSIVAAVAPNPVGAGGTLTYTLAVANNGPGAATSVIVSDSLPSTTAFVSCAATAGGICGGAGNNRTISFGSLAAGDTAAITLVARVNASVPGGIQISNTASISSSTPDPGTANNSAIAVARVIVTSVPAAPSNLTATALLPTRTRLAWTDNSDNESYFFIEHSRDGTTFKQIARVGPNMTTFTFTLSDMTGGTTHHYRVRAYNANGYSTYSNRATLTMPRTPAAPSNLTATALLPTRTKLAWTDNSDNESYFFIEHSRDGTTFKQIAGVVTNVTTFTFTLPDMTGGTTHYYRVRAYGANGYSAYSNRATLAMPGAPVAAGN